MNLYSNEIKQFVVSRDWPKGLMIQIEQKETEGTPWLQFILYRNNYESFSGEDKWRIHWVVKEVIETIRKQGIPMYLEVSDDG